MRDNVRCPQPYITSSGVQSQEDDLVHDLILAHRADHRLFDINVSAAVRRRWDLCHDLIFAYVSTGKLAIIFVTPATESGASV